MSKTVKIWLIVAASLILSGCIVFGGVMSMLKWDFKKLSTNKYETNTYEINEEFINLLIKTDTAKIVFMPSADGKCRVECYEQENEKHSVTVENNTLVIDITEEKAWFEYININFASPQLTVYLPNTEYDSLTINESTGNIEIPNDFNLKNIDISITTGDVKCSASASEAIKIKTSTGNIDISAISAGSLDLSTTTGKITVTDARCDGEIEIKVNTGKARLTDISCKSLISSGSTGDLSLKDVVATEKFSINRSTGDIKFEACDAAEIFVNIDTGDVEGTLLSDKVFIIKTDTGKIDVPNSITGGRCEITTDTGDIKISIA